MMRGFVVLFVICLGCISVQSAPTDIKSSLSLNENALSELAKQLNVNLELDLESMRAPAAGAPESAGIDTTSASAPLQSNINVDQHAQKSPFVSTERDDTTVTVYPFCPTYTSPFDPKLVADSLACDPLHPGATFCACAASAFCFSTTLNPNPTCRLAAGCWLCQYAPLVAAASGISCPTLAALHICDCRGPLAGAWHCPQPAEVVFPAAFEENSNLATGWHYTTGKLSPTAPSLRDMGFQFTIFRFTTIPGTLQYPTSSFALHFALTNPNSKDQGFLFAQNFYNVFEVSIAGGDQFSIKTTGLGSNPFEFTCVSGVAGQKGAVWKLAATGTHMPGGIPSNIQFGVQLYLLDSKGAALHGDRGLSQKAYQRCSTSLYFSMTALKIAPGYTSFAYIGDPFNPANVTTFSGIDAWYDREQSVGDLENFNAQPSCPNKIDRIDPTKVSSGEITVANLTGWYWASIHIPRIGVELMLFKMAKRLQPDDYEEPLARGTLVFPAGTGVFSDVLLLSPSEITMNVLETATFPSGRIYPISTQVNVANPTLSLQFTCNNVNYARTSPTEVLQELSFSPSNGYLEGLATCTGRYTYSNPNSANSRPSGRPETGFENNGFGYMERTFFSS